MTKWCRTCLDRFQADPEQLEWRVTQNGAVLAVGVCPRCGAVTGPSFVPVATAPASVQVEARAVASAHRRAREDLRAFRNAAMVLLYSKLAPKRQRNRPLPWDAPTVATLSQCFALSERRVREILETVDERAATELIDGMRRQRRPRRSQIDMDGPAEIQLPGEF